MAEKDYTIPFPVVGKCYGQSNIVHTFYSLCLLNFYYCDYMDFKVTPSNTSMMVLPECKRALVLFDDAITFAHIRRYIKTIPTPELHAPILYDRQWDRLAAHLQKDIDLCLDDYALNSTIFKITSVPREKGGRNTLALQYWRVEMGSQGILTWTTAEDVCNDLQNFWKTDEFTQNRLQFSVGDKVHFVTTIGSSEVHGNGTIIDIVNKAARLYRVEFEHPFSDGSHYSCNMSQDDLTPRS